MIQDFSLLPPRYRPPDHPSIALISLALVILAVFAVALAWLLTTESDGLAWCSAIWASASALRAVGVNPRVVFRRGGSVPPARAASIWALVQRGHHTCILVISWLIVYRNGDIPWKGSPGSQCWIPAAQSTWSPASQPLALCLSAQMEIVLGSGDSLSHGLRYSSH